MNDDRAPGMVWVLRGRAALAEYPNGYVLTSPGDEIRVTYFEDENYAQTLFLSRKDARLLAKRINQCLDSTAKR